MSIIKQNQDIQDLLVERFINGSAIEKSLCNKVAGIMLDNIPKVVCWRYRRDNEVEGKGIWQYTDDEHHAKLLIESKAYEIEELYC